MVVVGGAGAAELECWRLQERVRSNSGAAPSPRMAREPCVALLLLLVASASHMCSSHTGVSPSRAWVEQCLRTEGADECNLEQQEKATARYLRGDVPHGFVEPQRDCLLANVPFYGTPYSRVECCMYSCLTVNAERTGLAENWRRSVHALPPDAMAQWRKWRSQEGGKSASVLYGHSGFSSQLKNEQELDIYSGRPDFTIASDRRSSLSFITEPLLQKEMYRQVFDVQAYEVEQTIGRSYKQLQAKDLTILAEVGPPPTETPEEDPEEDPRSKFKGLHPQQTAWDLKYFRRRTYPQNPKSNRNLRERTRLVSTSGSTTDVQTLIWRNTTYLDLLLNYVTTHEPLPTGKANVKAVRFNSLSLG